jgi:hypothetical protein
LPPPSANCARDDVPACAADQTYAECTNATNFARQACPLAPRRPRHRPPRHPARRRWHPAARPGRPRRGRRRDHDHRHRICADLRRDRLRPRARALRPARRRRDRPARTGSRGAKLTRWLATGAPGADAGAASTARRQLLLDGSADRRDPVRCPMAVAAIAARSAAAGDQSQTTRLRCPARRASDRRAW